MGFGMSECVGGGKEEGMKQRGYTLEINFGHILAYHKYRKRNTNMHTRFFSVEHTHSR